jgi:hypothetical protein
MSYYEKDIRGFTRLNGAKVTCVPILIPHLKVRKTKIVFIVLAMGKEFTCVAWGRLALDMGKILHIGIEVHVYGKEKKGYRRPNLHIYTITLPQAMAYDAVFRSEKPKIWDLLSKVPVVSNWIPEQMKL